MRKFIVAAALVAGLGGGVAFADQNPTSGETQTASPKADKGSKPAEDPNRMVCTREHVVGSNRPQKVCMTVAEREKLRDSAERELDATRRRGTQNPGETE